MGAFSRVTLIALVLADAAVVVIVRHDNPSPSFIHAMIIVAINRRNVTVTKLQIL
jgi:hypothetical protein